MRYSRRGGLKFVSPIRYVNYYSNISYPYYIQMNVRYDKTHNDKYPTKNIDKLTWLTICIVTILIYSPLLPSPL